jgi:hypothetical protein
MKIKCTCGEIIRDQTDYLPNKAHVIGDKDYFDLLDRIDEAVETASSDKDKALMAIRIGEPSRLAWECMSCGRLYFDDGQGGLVEYAPQNGRANAVFDRPRDAKAD